MPMGAYQHWYVKQRQIKRLTCYLQDRLSGGLKSRQVCFVVVGVWDVLSV